MYTSTHSISERLKDVFIIIIITFYKETSYRLTLCHQKRYSSHFPAAASLLSESLFLSSSMLISAFRSISQTKRLLVMRLYRSLYHNIVSATSISVAVHGLISGLKVIKKISCSTQLMNIKCSEVVLLRNSAFFGLR